MTAFVDTVINPHKGISTIFLCTSQSACGCLLSPRQIQNSNPAFLNNFVTGTLLCYHAWRGRLLAKGKEVACRLPKNCCKNLESWMLCLAFDISHCWLMRATSNVYTVMLQLLQSLWPSLCWWSRGCAYYTNLLLLLLPTYTFWYARGKEKKIRLPLTMT
jgi:hypothetical protein